METFANTLAQYYAIVALPFVFSIASILVLLATKVDTCGSSSEQPESSPEDSPSTISANTVSTRPDEALVFNPIPSKGTQQPNNPDLTPMRALLQQIQSNVLLPSSSKPTSSADLTIPRLPERRINGLQRIEKLKQQKLEIEASPFPNALSPKSPPRSIPSAVPSPIPFFTPMNVYNGNLTGYPLVRSHSMSVGPFPPLASHYPVRDHRRVHRRSHTSLRSVAVGQPA
ncbi:hypothetical protein BLNAU_23486 [Blattamonas nauphoetae]|uniref:Uncharacterized protein n=1 Tax=Blattamonas nauphoetae TaxID=2049346 RepID=A0ABQ9WQ46_9EUKA|nr:hypothetical protein BLNAU_23486 [Blattamonas nauphoetae]